MKNVRFGLGILLLVLLAVPPAFSAEEEHPPLPGDLPLDRFPETDQVRRKFADSLIFAPRDSVLAFKPVEAKSGIVTVRASVARRQDGFYAVFEPRRPSGYAIQGQGTWIVKRSMKDGSFIQAKVFMRSDENVYMRLYPFKDRTKLEFIAYGGVLAKGVVLPWPFAETILLPVSRIVEMSRASVDWSVLDADPALTASVRGMADKIRAYLPRLSYGEDGAVDANGRAVLIATGKPQSGKPVLNCSGFAKWIVDGIYATAAPAGDDRPLLTDIGELKSRDASARGNSFSQPFEESRDPYFGFDWTRHLAIALLRRLEPSGAGADPDPVVRISPFGEFKAPEDIYSSVKPYDLYPAFKPEAGYQVRGLKALLYVLASKEPGSFYLASRSYRQGKPQLRQHTHILALFPYFDEGRIFRVAVFESAAETGIDKFMTMAGSENEDYFAYLVSLPADSRYDPELAMWRSQEGGTERGQ